MKKMRWLLLTLVLLLAFLFVGKLVADYPDGLWRLLNPPLVPSYAMNVQTPVSSMDDDFDLRRITFETDQLAGTIQQFYRAELPKRGWTYRCTVRPADPPCGTWFPFASESELVEVYDRGTSGASNWYTYEISISLPDASGIREVWLYEGGWGRRAFPDVPTASEGLEFAILGNWRTTDDSSGIDFILRFYEGGGVRILFPSLAAVNGLDGRYEWSDNGDLRLIFRWDFQPIDSDKEACKKYTPSFLKGFCQHSVVKYDPESYPEPAVVPQSIYPEPYPVLEPSPSPGAISQIDEFFDVAIDGDTLTLTHQSGTTQTFHRVTGN